MTPSQGPSDRELTSMDYFPYLSSADSPCLMYRLMDRASPLSQVEEILSSDNEVETTVKSSHLRRFFDK